MAQAPLLQLSDISLTFGDKPLFDGLDALVQEGDRVALVGRNGSGKSTLLKVMAGSVEPDDGTRAVAPGRHVAYLEQDPDFSDFATLGDFAVSGLDPSQHYLVEMAAEGLKFDPSRASDQASGGEKRRAALAKVMAEGADLLLLDEPTNHLDIQAIEWLEARLREIKTAYVVISHDRRFLEQLTKATLWVDRGQVRRQAKGFSNFEIWRDETWAAEDSARHKLKRKIKEEARWAVEGISARRKRNMGRVRALGELRQQQSEQIKRQTAAPLKLETGQKSGRKIVEIQKISKAFEDRVILRDFSINVQRGDRIGIVGPNGAGKTTLLKLILGDLAPDTGVIKKGSNLVVAEFDQTRSIVDPDHTLWEALIAEKDLGVTGRSDQIMVRGTPKHVVGYLKEFLFDEAQARAPVRSLSGGERARLLLARILAKECNVLILDEPTNDLDIETLDVLQDMLADYDGTVFVVSHDRDFLDRVATQTIYLDGKGSATVYAGGWSQVKVSHEDRAGSSKKKTKKSDAPKAQEKMIGLSYVEKHRLAELPSVMERTSAEIAKLEEFLSDPEMFTKEPVKFQKATDALVVRHNLLADMEVEWLTLAEKEEQGA